MIIIGFRVLIITIWQIVSEKTVKKLLIWKKQPILIFYLTLDPDPQFFNRGSAILSGFMAGPRVFMQIYFHNVISAV